jgi:hypothetical protein
MRWMDQLAMKARLLFGRRRAAAQLDEELRFHLDQQIEEYVRAGMRRDEARATALRAFGNPALLRDETRTTWCWSWLEVWIRDARIAARTLWRTPGFSLIAIAVMALGIGANIALFTVVRGVLLRPLPFHDPDRLISLYEHTNEQFVFNSVSGGVFSEWQKQNQSFATWPC